MTIEEYDPDHPWDWDSEVGAAALALDYKNRRDAVMVLMGVTEAQRRWIDTTFGGGSCYHVFLFAHAAALAAATESVLEEIRVVLDAGARADGDEYRLLNVLPSRPVGDWRPHLRSAGSKGQTNQATLLPLPAGHPTLDGMGFRDAGEMKVYQAAVKIQTELPANDTIAIAVNPSVRVRGHTWEPDFIITYRGRAGLIAVDGGSHYNRWQADRTRDNFYEDAGFAYVARLAVEDTDVEEQVEAFLRRFLKRLAEPRA